KLKYYKETDSLYIDLSSKPSIESMEIQEGLVIDFDANNRVTGIDISNASKWMDFTNVNIDIPTSRLIEE
ncbi:MAG: DUF2283 domain-containing protein, partial [Bacteroidales bacterium]|nr:DUF2283 domain-containing protein [Bacteroidales bacterium]